MFGADTITKDGEIFSEYRLHDGSSTHDAQVAWYTQLLASGRAAPVDRSGAFTDLHRRWAVDRATFGADYTANFVGAMKLELRRAYANNVTPQADTWLHTADSARCPPTDVPGAQLLVLYRQHGSRRCVARPPAVGTGLPRQQYQSRNALGRYEYKTEKDDASSEARSAHIISGHSDYHPSRPWWMTGPRSQMADRALRRSRLLLHRTIASGRSPTTSHRVGHCALARPHSPWASSCNGRRGSRRATNCRPTYGSPPASTGSASPTVICRTPITPTVALSCACASSSTRHSSSTRIDAA